MSNKECPNFKLAWNGDCKYYGEDCDEGTGDLIRYCACDGVELKFKDCCDQWSE